MGRQNRTPPVTWAFIPSLWNYEEYWLFQNCTDGYIIFIIIDNIIEPIAHTHKEQDLDVDACTVRDSVLNDMQMCTDTHSHTHTLRVCRWAEAVGEGLGGWYKASLKYKQNNQPPRSHFNMADAAVWVRFSQAGLMKTAVTWAFSQFVSVISYTPVHCSIGHVREYVNTIPLNSIKYCGSATTGYWWKKSQHIVGFVQLSTSFQFSSSFFFYSHPVILFFSGRPNVFAHRTCCSAVEAGWLISVVN